MKENYENRTRSYVPRRTYSIIRLDGCHFRTYTKKLLKPFDHNLYKDMDNAIIVMLPHIQGAVFAYTQSDEISVLLTDFATDNTSVWFDGNIQKMTSISSSIITAEFNRLRLVRNVYGADLSGVRNVIELTTPAYFDSRIFTIPDRTEVMNYFIWRGNDCSRNSISMNAQSLFSHKELQGKSTTMMLEMMKKYKSGAFAWESLNQDLRFGRMIVKESYFVSPRGNEISEQYVDGAERTRWVSTPAWRFIDDKEKLMKMIPKYV